MPTWIFASRSLSAMAVLGGLILVEASRARADTTVLSIVEMEDVIFFQPSNAPDVVWYIPRTTTRFAEAEESPGFWRASVVLRDADLDVPLASLNPDWQGATLVPFIVRPTRECTLDTSSGLRLVQQQVRAQGRDVSAAIEVPVCQFSFRLPRNAAPTLIEELQAAADGGTLIEYELALSLQQQLSISWSVLHAAVARELKTPASRPISTEAAIQAVDDALGASALSALASSMTPEEAAEARELLLSRLFVAVGTRKRLVAGAPSGTMTYHTARHSYQL
jgi:hypothetical protein